jgi:hypothetical protein
MKRLPRSGGKIFPSLFYMTTFAMALGHRDNVVNRYAETGG